MADTEKTIDEQIVDAHVYADPARYHRLFAALRRDDPVRWTTPTGYRPFWTVSKHADISEVQRQPDIFVNGQRLTLVSIEAEEKIRAATGNDRVQRTLLSLDGAEHMTMRNLTRDWFMPAGVARIEADIERIARSSVDRMVALDGACDFSTDIAVPYPLRVIMSLFGLPPESEAMMLRLSKEINGAQDAGLKRSESEGEHTLAVLGELFAFFATVADECRRNPRDDLASLIANARIEGRPLTDREIFSYYLVITIAGHDTTSTSLATGMIALIEHPQEFAKLRANPKLLTKAADEMVRWAHPVKHFMRTATRDYDLRGQKIRAGDSLLMALPSACRDEEVFDDPFAFRIDRSPNRHLAFGVGPHVCLGQYLAKVELAAFFRVLMERTEEIELDGDPVVIESLFLGGFKRIPVRYRMRSSAPA